VTTLVEVAVTEAKGSTEGGGTQENPPGSAGDGRGNGGIDAFGGLGVPPLEQLRIKHRDLLRQSAFTGRACAAKCGSGSAGCAMTRWSSSACGRCSISAPLSSGWFSILALTT
jgi:hypothetical protein